MDGQAVRRVVEAVSAGSRFGDAVRDVSTAEGYDVRQTIRLRDAARLTLEEVGPTDRCTIDVLGVSSYRCRCAVCVDARDAIARVLERHRLSAPAPVPDVEALRVARV